MTTTPINDVQRDAQRRSELRDLIASLRKNHSESCTGCAFEDVVKEADRLDEYRNEACATLLRRGVRDSDMAVHIVDTLARHGFTITDPPTSAHGATVEAVFCELTSPERVILGDLIDGDWPSWLHQALEYAEEADDDARARDAVKEKLAAAHRAVRDVRARLAMLRSVEDDTEGFRDVNYYLTQAERALRTANHINNAQ